MTDIICPLCGKANPSDRNECQYCQAPLKSAGFLAPEEGQASPVPPIPEELGKPEDKPAEPDSATNLEQSVPDWLKQTEAGFLEPSEPSEPSTNEPEEDRFSERLDSLLNPPPATQEPQGNAIDDDWLASLLAEAGAVEPPRAQKPPGTSEDQGLELPSEGTTAEIGGEIEEEPATPTLPSEKPDWLADLEASSTIKLEGGIFQEEAETESLIPPELPEEKAPEPSETPEWLTKAGAGEPVEPLPQEEAPTEGEAPIAPAELPGWLEAIRPSETASPTASVEPPTHEEATTQGQTPPEGEESLAPGELPGWLEAIRPSNKVSPTGPVEDLSRADLVTAGPLMGLRGVISAHPSAIRAQKPPTYSIKLKVTEEQQARLLMMEELLADEGKPKPLPTKPIITSRHILRLIVAIILLLPILWMIIANSSQSSTSQPENIPGVADFTERIQGLTANSPVLVAFDYEAGFSGELNPVITNVFIQLMEENTYITLVTTTPSGPALAESMISSASSKIAGKAGAYQNYADLGYIPGGTLGLLGLAASPRSILPYALDGTNVWAEAPLEAITAVKDFAAIIVITNDPDTARNWIEQVGTQLQDAGTPLLFITSAQAEPLIRPYFQATPAQVQGLIAGLAGSVAFANLVGNYQPDGTWDAYSAGVTVSVLIILIGSTAGVMVKMIAPEKKKGS